MYSKKHYYATRPHVAIAMTIIAVTMLMLVASCNSSGPGPESDAVMGSVTNISGCKMFETGKAGAFRAPDQSCISYEYDLTGKLYLQHINAGFNCCTNIEADFSIAGGVITITEKEGGDYCHCLCLYDLECEINNLPIDSYTIKIVELYTSDDDDPIEFSINLKENKSGQYCVTRNYYPWGGGVFEGQ